jgi:elongation factor P
MTASNQIVPGMTISLEGNIYRVESCVKVTVSKGNPFIKTKLKNLKTDETVEKSFKVGQTVQDVSLQERRLEFLYLEGKDYLFLDVGNLDQVLIPVEVIGDKVTFLKEGVEIRAMFYGDTVFSIELPQFLELMVVKTEFDEAEKNVPTPSKVALLETGAKIAVPPFVEAGDIVKVDTGTCEFVQRV